MNSSKRLFVNNKVSFLFTNLNFPLTKVGLYLENSIV